MFDFAINTVNGTEGIAGFTGGMEITAMRPFLMPSGKRVLNVNSGNLEPEMIPYVSQLCVNQEGKKAYRAIQANAATLRKDEWVHFDSALQGVFQRPRAGIDDLVSRNLTYDFNGYAASVLEFESISDTSGVGLAMDPDSQGTQNTAKYELASLPLPIFHAEFSLGDRYLQMSRTRGTPMDTSLIEKKGKDMMEGLEYLLFNGVVEGSSSAFKYAGSSIYGYLNWPSSVPVNFTAGAGKGWTHADTTAAGIVADVQNLIQALRNNRCFGPYMVYIPSSYWKKMSGDYAAGYPKTILQRIKEVEPQVIDIKISEFIAGDKVVAVQMDKSTVRLVRGLAMTPVQTQLRPYGRHEFQILMIQVPQLRTDGAGRSGVAVLQ